MSELKTCPCGAVPERIAIHSEAGKQAKYAYASGSCCNEWSVEFRNDYAEIGGAESMAAAIEEWNMAKRGAS